MASFPDLSRAELTRRLRQLKPTDEMNSTGRKDGAVMLIFMDQPQGLSLLFTKRAADLEEHPGQISFPGGALEPDDSSLEKAALRETFEEVGIEDRELEVLGALPCQPVLDHWLIHPFTAWWTAPHRLKPNPAEVDRVIIPSLAELSRQHRPGCWQLPDPEQACRYMISEELLWGATARITGRLLDSLLIPIGI